MKKLWNTFKPHLIEEAMKKEGFVYDERPLYEAPQYDVQAWDCDTGKYNIHLLWEGDFRPSGLGKYEYTWYYWNEEGRAIRVYDLDGLNRRYEEARQAYFPLPKMPDPISAARLAKEEVERALSSPSFWKAKIAKEERFWRRMP